MSMQFERLGNVLIDIQPGFASGKNIVNGTLQVRMNNVKSDGSWDWSKERRVPATDRQKEKYFLCKGDILFNATNSPEQVGKSAIFLGADEEVAFSNHFLRLRVNENLVVGGYLVRYFAYLWRLGTFKNMVDAWVNQATVQRDGFLNLKIPLPPLPEQKRIAAILDKADAIRRKRQQAVQLANQFIRALFLELFGDPVTNPKGWKKVVLGDLIEFAKDGPHVSPIYSDSGIPFLSTRHIRPTGVVWKDLKYITKNEAGRHWKKCKPQYGDILYTKGGTTGVACQVDFETDFAIWVHVALLRPLPKKANFIWLTHMLNSRYSYLQSQKYTRGATNKDLGLTRMIDISMYCPPLTLQEQFVEIRDKLVNLVRASDVLNNEKLFESLNQKAFAGEL